MKLSIVQPGFSMKQPATEPASAETGHTGRATLADVAARAGVSLATADRVMHERKGVRAATRHAVLEAASKLEYLPAGTLEGMLKPPPLRLAFILPKGPNRFIKLLAEYVERIEDQLGPYNIAGRV